MNKGIGTKKILGGISAFLVVAICVSCTSQSTVVSSDYEQPEYVTTIFNKDEIMDIDIQVDENEWQNLLDTAIEEEYMAVDISVNGTTYNNVAIRAKGNSTLTQVYSDDSTDRYSFKINFGKYEDGQTLDGLKKLVLNNTMSDTTYMKEYMSYEILSYLGVATPAYTYANITVNGEPWGLYFALEPIEEEFIERYYGSADGNLYKPESDSVAMGDKGNIEIPDINSDFEMPSMDGNMQMPDMNGDFEMPSMDGNMQMPDMNGDFEMPSMDGNMQMPDINGDFEMPSMDGNMQMPDMNGGKGMMGGNSNGADLVWNGDDIENYSAIFDNAKFKSTTEDDYSKILDMIEHLDTMEDIEDYLDVDNVLRYFAANTFMVNLDSYASSMNHNYYLYEDDGLVSILPWDYNLSFAGFQAGTASNAINFPIDCPVTDSLEASPLIGKLLEVDKYKELYHSYLNDLVENFINNGEYENVINKVDALISDYVENDATAFYTFEEYKASLEHLINFGYDRATSISEQLDGNQPSTTSGNIETTVDLNAMGQQGGGDKGDMTGKENKVNKGERTFPDGDTNMTPPMEDQETSL